MKIIIRKNWIKLRLKIVRLFSSWSAPRDFPKSGPRVILALAADYGNLGDVAITKAMIEFLKHTLPSHSIYLLTAGRIYRDLRGVANAASPDDIIAIVGGGNMGDLYPDLEEARRLTVRAFKNQKIVSFPQSIGFSLSASGAIEEKKSSKAYCSAERLTIFAREKFSLLEMKKSFPDNQVFLSPDIVFSLKQEKSIARGAKILVCLRQDAEADIIASRRAAILAKISSCYREIEIADTAIAGPRLSFNDYQELLSQFLNRLQGSQCVVTDRLHGMIFSVITQTPCVVIENNNHKIRATYDTWLSRHPSVVVLKTPTDDEVLAAINQVTLAPASAVNLDEFFVKLKQTLIS